MTVLKGLMVKNCKKKHPNFANLFSLFCTEGSTDSATAIYFENQNDNKKV